MSFWRRFRNSLRGPMHVEGEDDAEVEADLDDEMPDAAEDAKEAADDERMATVTSLFIPNTASTIAFEGAEVDANEDAEASARPS